MRDYEIVSDGLRGLIATHGENCEEGSSCQAIRDGKSALTALENMRRDTERLPGLIAQLRAELRQDLGILKAMETERDQLRASLPTTFYAEIPFPERVKHLAEQWNRSVGINQTLEAELAARDAALAEAERVISHCADAMAGNNPTPEHWGDARRSAAAWLAARTK